jgi:transposase
MQNIDMDVHRAFRYKLAPTAEQEVLFRQFAGVCRLIYNLALEQRRDWWRHYQRQTGCRLNYVAQARDLTVLRAEYDWIAAVSQTCSACGTVDRASRKSQAVFLCQHCGFRAHADHNAAINILRRNTAFMDVEEGHWFSDEASTGSGFAPAENLPASAGGRC